MQDAKRNVVELSQYGRPRASAREGGRLLDECGETVAMRLGQAMSRTLKRSGDDLLELIDQITSYEMRRLYGEARELSRDKAAALETAVKRHFYQQFKRECRRDSSRAGNGVKLDATQLSLMEPDDLEESLAASNIANAIANICGEELFGLSKRMGVLLEDPELEFGDNPIGPEAIGTAVMEALREHADTVKLRLALVPMVGKHLPKLVREIYQDINRDLIDRGVLPTIRVGLKRSQPSAAAPHNESPGGNDSQRPQSGQPGSGGQDLLTVLQQMLALGQSGPAPAGGLPDVRIASPGLPGQGNLGDLLTAAGPQTVTQSPATTAFVQHLTGMQRGQAGGLPLSPLVVEQIAGGQVNVLRELRGQAVHQGMAQVDVMILDIVAMVFDYILDDSRIPDAMKALIGRLQIPVLKVAMLDRNFFSQKQHVVRRLLDTLADASMGWDEQEGHQGGLYRKMDELVQRILNQFEQQVDIFDICLDEFEQYLREENRHMAEAAGRSAQVIQRQEARQRSHAFAADTVRTHLFDQNVPELIGTFLTRHWVEVLADIQGRNGEDGPAWQGAVAAMDDLIWSVEPKHVQEDRKKLVRLLPKLLKRLDQGLRDINLDQKERDRFFADLVKCHAEAVRASMQAHPIASWQPTMSGDALPPQVETEPANQDFETVPETDQTPDPTLLREIAATGEADQDEVEEITISDVHWLAGGDFRESDEHEAQVRGLKRGAWIEIRQEDGQETKAKLAWVSPLKGVYLFTNRLGQRAMSINAEGLAAKFRDGSVRVIDSVPLMDRAVNNLLERLKHPTAMGS